MEDQKNQKIFRMQPILCPWITSQPYHSSLWNKNRASTRGDPSLTNRFLNNPWINRQMPLGLPRSQDKPLPSIQQSSSQFFYFLRLMQLFPDTHPATLHTVLMLCKNDFFCAVDKMLYAKRCKLLCYKKNLIQKNCQNRGCRSNGGAEGSGMMNKVRIESNVRQMVQMNKVAVGNNGSGDKKREDSLLSSQEGVSDNDSIAIASCAEKPEDLSTVKKIVDDASQAPQ